MQVENLCVYMRYEKTYVKVKSNANELHLEAAINDICRSNIDTDSLCRNFMRGCIQDIKTGKVICFAIFFICRFYFTCPGKIFIYI